MASHSAKPHYPVRPGIWLGLFFWVVFVGGIAVTGIELRQMYNGVEEGSRVFGLDGTKWLAFLGGWGAIWGAITSARITLRNAVKQHTITTLLQMRMSETYMIRAQKVSATYFPPQGIYLVRDEAGPDPRESDHLPELVYVLNYLEFISSAIRYGDLHEGLMRESLRGLVCNLFECAKPLIDFYRISGQAGPNPQLFEHLEWLYRRWFVEAYKRPWIVRVG